MSLRTVLLVSHLDLNILLFRRALIQVLVERSIRTVVTVPPPLPGAEDFSPRVEALGAEVVHRPLVRGSLNPLTVPAAVKGLKDVIASVRPDVVHSFTHQPNIFTRLAAPRSLPVVNSITGLGSCFTGHGTKGRIMRAVFHSLYRFTSGRCAALVFQNSDDKVHFERHGLTGSARRILIRGSGTDLEKFRPDLMSPDARSEYLRSLKMDPDSVVCVFAARLIKEKGVEEFVQAAHILADERPNASFLAVGEPDPGNPKSLKVEDMRKASEAANIVFTGRRDDMDMVWAAADIAVLPSYYGEGLPVSLQEAAAAGVPSIAADSPGCRDIACDSDHCILVPPKDGAALAQALRELIDSPERCAAMSTAAREKAERDFDAYTLARKHIHLYEDILAGSAG